MSVIDKQRVAQAFGQAAKTYDSVAHFQRTTGANLVAKIPTLRHKTLVDLGCGTGYFSESLKVKFL